MMVFRVNLYVWANGEQNLARILRELGVCLESFYYVRVNEVMLTSDMTASVVGC